MFKLEDRKKHRAHMAKVNSGQINDPVALYGTDEKGDVIGDDGKPVPGTAAKGREASAPAPAEEKPDYSKLTTQADLDGALGDRAKPEGWDKLKVEEKQKWLTDNAAKPSGGW